MLKHRKKQAKFNAFPDTIGLLLALQINYINSQGTRNDIQHCDMPVKKQPLRIIHNMARSGSTLICKCLGCMHRIALLSEIHPAATQMFNPLNQAHHWFSLLNKKDIAQLQQGRVLDFVDTIRLIDKRSRQKKKVLVIRDWAHLDFTGHPFLDNPARNLALANVLQEHFVLIQTAIVRHPIDQWLSLSRLAVMQEPIKQGKLTVRTFLEGYEAFARYCVETGFMRYEDFTSHPEKSMQDMCKKLALPFDAGFISRWVDYRTITGDVQSTRGSDAIKTLKRRNCDSAVLKLFENEDSYWHSLQILGYSVDR